MRMSETLNHTLNTMKIEILKIEYLHIWSFVV